MTDLNNQPAIHENENDAAEKPSQGVMLITMLLLIGGLLLTSTMLLYYGFKRSGETGESGQELAQVWQQIKSQFAEHRASRKTSPPTPAPDAPETETESSGFNIKELFSRTSDGQVRWPRLKLSGFGLPSEGEVAFAIINNKQVVEGNVVNGAKVVEIQEHGVVLEYKGETRTLIVEMTEH